MSSNFEKFKAAFQGDIVTPESPDYEASLKRWAANAERRAKLVAFVKNPQDVALAIKYAKDEQLDLSVRGGGHNPAGGSSSDGGIVIDLSRHLTGCRVDAENKRAYVDGGAIWKTVDHEAIKYGLATVGGQVNHTGVGGLTLGGGYGWLSSEHGLVIDNVLQVTIVVADGSVLTANATENPDLYWAIRGGGGNFGVVTEFVYQLHEQRRTLYSGALIYGPHLVDALLVEVEKWNNSSHTEKEGLLLALAQGPPPEYGPPSMMIIPFFNGPEEEGRKLFKPFLDLNPIDMSKEIPYEMMNSMQNFGVAHGQGVYMRGVTQLKFSPATAKEVFEFIVKNSSKDMRVTCVFELMPLDKINSVSNNACAFNIRGPTHNVVNVITWEHSTPEDAKRGPEIGRAMSDIITNKEPKPEDARERAYGNYVGDHIHAKDKAARMFGDNYPRLQSIKKKYDPDVIFNKWYPITPA